MIPKKILVVSAHAADWCTRSGGTLIKYIKAGCKVTVFAFTSGEHGESGGYWKNNPESTVEACKECRKNEARAAAAVIGVDSIEFFDFRDYPLDLNTDQIRNLGHRILHLRPDVILTHWIKDPFNFDHEVTAKAVIRAVSAAGMLGAQPNTPSHFIPDIFLFESTIPHSEFNEFKMDTYVDIEDTFEQKMEAIRRFEAQPQLVEYYTRCALTRGIQATDWARGRRIIRYAEGFSRYTPYLGDYLPFTKLHAVRSKQ
ncbi:MAG: PIG-L family deacetylase [Ruminococcaceae bacterium]|nr:PIG-L family deacetylase [Oscillospiraceae bacterium]